MKLSVSNIAWSPERDETVLNLLKKHGFSGVEIAPTRLFPEAPYDRIDEAKTLKNDLETRFKLEISSMQSIWYGVSDRIFGTPEERTRLTAYSHKAICFAEAVNCQNLVFGCPRNRSLPDGADPKTALPFFRELGEYAKEHHTVVALEANPPIYNTNYINTTREALSPIREVGSEGFRLNLDVGTMVENREDVSVLKGSEQLIHHVHISEPGLVPIQQRALHKELAAFLRAFGYQGWVSIEVKRRDDPGELESMLEYVAGLFA